MKIFTNKADRFGGRHAIIKRWIMRISVTYFLGIAFSIQLLMANTGIGQGIEETKVTLDGENITLTKAINEIQKQTNFLFLFPPNILIDYPDLSIHPGTRTVQKTLELLLHKTPLGFKQVNDNILIFRLIPENQNTQTNPANITGVDAPLRTLIAGRVTDIHGAGMAGVNVIVKGSTRGTSTDADGKFSIDVNPDDELIFSFIGYKTIETPVGNRTTVDVVMEEDIASLKEVVVNAGYYQVKEKNATGSISRLAASEIEKQPVTNPLVALQGRMPGVYIQQSSGVPGGKVNIQIRGRNSMLRNGNEPLYIVDGVPFVSTPLGSSLINLESTQGGNPLNILNPSDIESVEVLKDADATAVYGSLGSNGVVLITTKKAKAGKTKFDINVYTGAGRVANKVDLLTTNQYLEMRHEAFANDGVSPGEINPDPDLLSWDTTRYTDWQKEFMGGTANITSAQASISGGNSNTQFILGSGFYKEGTVFPRDFSYSKISSHLTLTHGSDNQKFNSTLSVNFGSDKNLLPYRDGTFLATTLAPNAPSVFDEQGNLNWENNTWENPFSAFVRTYEARTTNLITNGQVSYKILPGVQIKANVGYSSIRVREMRLVPKSSFRPTSTSKASSAFGDDNNITWLIEPQMDYNKSIGKGTFSALVGTTFRESTGDRQLLNATGYNSDSFLKNIQAASSVTVGGYNYFKYKYNAIFTRLNYNWDEKYIINLTGRRDGSSRFGPGNRFANFGAIGLAWIFSNEAFMDDLQNVLSFGKLRSSYGTTGNDQIGDYQYLDTYKPTFYPYLGNAGLEPTRLANSDFGWETNRKFELAVELGFFADKVFLSAAYYKNRSGDQLVGNPLAYTTGFTSIVDNFPAIVENTGIELMLNSSSIKSGNFAWASSINLTIPRNELVSFPNIEATSLNNLYEVGKSLFIQKGLNFKGVDPATGLFTFVDKDGDGFAVYPTDVQGLKKIAQDFYGGFQNSLSYNRWQFDLFFQFVKQTGKNEYSNPNRNSPGGQGNQPVGVMDRWQKPGDMASQQKFTQDYADAFTAYNDYLYTSDGIIGDASFIRLKNVSLSYNLPEKLSRKVLMQNSRVYVQGQNLLTFTNYKGIDPENQSFENLPPLRVITAGVQLTF